MSVRKPKLMYPLRALLLLGGAGGCYAAATLLVLGNSLAGIPVLLISCALLVAGEVYNHRRLRRDWFHRRFRTYERFRAEVDLAELRRVREEKGEASVVRHLKTLYPMLPVPELVRLLKEEPVRKRPASVRTADGECSTGRTPE